MNHLETNKLIADFMGFEVLVKSFHGINILRSPDGVSYDVEGLLYHVDWNWLMPVVEKICRTVHVTNGYDIIIKNDKTTINDIDGDLVCEYIGDDSLLNTYNCIVDFIKWFNIK